MSHYQDTISSLPVDDQSTPDSQQMMLANSLFADKSNTTMSVVVNELKEVILIVILFVLFSSEQSSTLIRRFVPAAAKNDLYLIGIKCTILVFLYYVIKNFQLTRKN